MGLRIWRGLDEVGGGFGPCALTIGNFDGVHAGHRRICRRVVELARARGWKPSALTFDPHPLAVVAPEKAPLLLTTPWERAAMMEQEGIEQVLIVPFDRTFSEVEPEDFVRQVLVGRLDARAVLVGDNFRFGHFHAGDTRHLRALGVKYGFDVETVTVVSRRGATVSSSGIRRLVSAGDVARAARHLERHFTLAGEVVPGKGIGGRHTVPTLNLVPGAGVMPAIGVYITRTSDAASERTWPSVTNIGFSPTFGGAELGIETHLLAAIEGDSPRRIRIEFLRRLRGERTFAGAAELKAQILADVARALSYFRRLERWRRPCARP